MDCIGFKTKPNFEKKKKKKKTIQENIQMKCLEIFTFVRKYSSFDA